MDLSQPFETERLYFRILNMDDLNDVYKQFSDPDMCSYFSEPPVDLNEAKEIIEHYKDPNGKAYLRYGMFDKNTNAFIGTCGYHYWDQTLKQVEIGYDIWKDYWRKGYISEAIPVILNICFQHLNVDHVYVFVHPENSASVRSVEKFAFKYCEPCRKPDDDVTVCMKLVKEDWANLCL
ncbi:GNAT family N-acetyltransferase [Bacillus sp. 31A1R]|uniref:GNAT family N-acetyltransferase n=1 Tax=Robertmurraya mangrovi TaxID=3098077 RepID=A0ABU5J3C2_9BACI|nr:GNAT family N-acetyltransferase [Bacillus sp. 31A1R]MDZ5473923.1 GNAT family N-acetyltransferase [Bacillus sp. 31A1R]